MNRVLLFSGEPLLMEERIQYVPDHPTEIQLVSTHETKTICLGAKFNPVSNDLFTNSDNDLKVLRTGCMELKLLKNSGAASIAITGDKIFMCSKPLNGEEREIIVHDLTKGTDEVLASFKTNCTNAFHVSVSETFLAIVNREHSATCTIKLYHRANRSLLDVKLPYPVKPTNLMFLPDGTLLISGLGLEKTLCRFRLSENLGETPEMMWSCDLHDPCGLALADNGLIFVTRLQVFQPLTLVTQAGM